MVFSCLWQWNCICYILVKCLVTSASPQQQQLNIFPCDVKRKKSASKIENKTFSFNWEHILSHLLFFFFLIKSIVNCNSDNLNSTDISAINALKLLLTIEKKNKINKYWFLWTSNSIFVLFFCFFFVCYFFSFCCFRQKLPTLLQQIRVHIFKKIWARTAEIKMLFQRNHCLSNNSHFGTH